MLLCVALSISMFSVYPFRLFVLYSIRQPAFDLRRCSEVTAEPFPDQPKPMSRL